MIGFGVGFNKLACLVPPSWSLVVMICSLCGVLDAFVLVGARAKPSRSVLSCSGTVSGTFLGEGDREERDIQDRRAKWAKLSGPEERLRSGCMLGDCCEMASFKVADFLWDESTVSLATLLPGASHDRGLSISELFLPRAVENCLDSLVSGFGVGSTTIGSGGGPSCVREWRPLLLAKMEVSSSKSALKDGKSKSSKQDDKLSASPFTPFCVEEAPVPEPE